MAIGMESLNDTKIDIQKYANVEFCLCKHLAQPSTVHRQYLTSRMLIHSDCQERVLQARLKDESLFGTESETAHLCHISQIQRTHSECSVPRRGTSLFDCVLFYTGKLSSKTCAHVSLPPQLMLRCVDKARCVVHMWWYQRLSYVEVIVHANERPTKSM
jgi:hypothetical protein